MYKIISRPRRSGKTTMLLKMLNPDTDILIGPHVHSYSGLPVRVCSPSAALKTLDQYRGKKTRLLVDDWYDIPVPYQEALLDELEKHRGHLSMIAVGTTSETNYITMEIGMTQHNKIKYGSMVCVEGRTTPLEVVDFDGLCYRLENGDRVLAGDISLTPQPIKDWSFEAKHEGQIKFERIAADLTTANPIALVYSKSDDMAFVVMLQALVHKSDTVGIYCDVEPIESYETAEFLVARCAKSDMQEFVKWAKVVSKARWPVQNTSGVMHVRTPSM